MTTANQLGRYDRVQVVLHWLIAALILFMIGLGLYMVGLPKQSELPPGEESVRAFYFLLHKSMGITVGVLVLVRLFWRAGHAAPALPDFVPQWQQKASKLVHGLLYVLMVVVPVSGYMQSMYSKYDTMLWGYVLPRLAEPSAELRETFSEVHEILVFTLIGVLVVHIAAAVKHKLEGNGVTDRMTLKK
jgi:cytochrome b561